MKLIDKAALVAEIERLRRVRPSDSLQPTEENKLDWLAGKAFCTASLKVFLDTLEVKEMETWHLQEKEDIYDAVKNWSLQTFVCIMKDGTIQKFTGNLDEDCDGHINVHIYGVNDDYDNVDDIVKWIELT